MTTRTTPTPDVPVRSLREIVDALDEHPEWRTALRQRLLGEELLALPVVFAKFAVETTRRLDLLTGHVEHLTSDGDTLKANMSTLRSDVDTLKSDVSTLKSDVSTLKSDMRTVRNDVGELKGAHADAETRDRIDRIADELELEYRRTLKGADLRRMARRNGADLGDDEIKSFLDSDVVAEAVDADGTTTYIAVEASYTGDAHDAERAMNHARLMEQFTKKPCRAVIASKRNTERLTRMTESGQIAWHQLKVRLP